MRTTRVQHASSADPVILPNFFVDHCLGEAMVPGEAPQ